MDFIKRKRKKSFESVPSLNEVLEALDLNYPSIKCPIGIYGDVVNLQTCMIRCSFPCKVFTNFEYVLRECSEDGCNESTPCISCSLKVDKYKILLKTIREIYDSGYSYKKYKPARVEFHIDSYNKDYKLMMENRKRIKEIEETDD
jgi:hypothetical protein